MMPINIVEKKECDFDEVYSLISTAKARVWQQINQLLIKLYWHVGSYVSAKVGSDGWGKSVVQELSDYLNSKDSSIKGFSARNIWRMKQFFEAYNGKEKLPTLLTEISWSNHLHILSKTRADDERAFYLALAAKQRYSARDFARLIDTSTFERTQLADKKLSTVLTEFPVNPRGVFKDSYIFEFLGISDDYKEVDLKRSLIRHLKGFLLELGPDFSLIGEEFIVQVGMKDFRIDLLMHHRALNCLVAFEFKIKDFMPADLGQLQFYLEALDRDVKKPHENPSIGILICKNKDEEVVEYALSRNVSPTLIADYETKLVDKVLLQQKLKEFSAHINADIDEKVD